jgi:cobalt/nickel transport system permease protein
VSRLAATTLDELTRFLRSFFVAERTATADGFLQRRHPAAKVGVVVALVLAAAVTRTPAVLVGLGLASVVLALVSRVPLRSLLARSTAVPLFSLVVVLPQLVLTPGRPAVAMFGLAVTWEGLAYVGTFTLRVAVSVALLSVLLLTTRVSDLLGGLRALGAPPTLLWVVALTVRYLFLFLEELRRLVLARESRRTARESTRESWRDASRLAGAFFLRTIERGERVHRGMVARGGARPPTPYRDDVSVGWPDYLLALGAVAVLVATGVLRWVG